jgi:hypothetical protein
MVIDKIARTNPIVKDCVVLVESVINRKLLNPTFDPAVYYILKEDLGMVDIAEMYRLICSEYIYTIPTMPTQLPH